MPTQINGLPAHVLLIHAVVILVPVAGLVLIAQAWSKPVRRWAGIGGPLLCLGALVLVPVTTSAGEWFRDHLNTQFAASAPVKKHADLGGDLLPWVIAMFVLSVAVWVLDRRTAAATERVTLSPTAGTVAIQIVVAVLATVAALGAIRATALAGDSGARAVWEGSVVTR